MMETPHRAFSSATYALSPSSLRERLSSLATTPLRPVIHTNIASVELAHIQLQALHLSRIVLYIASCLQMYPANGGSKHSPSRSGQPLSSGRRSRFFSCCAFLSSAFPQLFSITC